MELHKASHELCSTHMVTCCRLLELLLSKRFWYTNAGFRPFHFWQWKLRKCNWIRKTTQI